ncbi:DUF551 domain-containing protein [Bradyrhizobium oligotrophicum]|uniref:DUF551 domain-containing protein n=1 Tax=Bradyrhizobium oligotrophicum TaxID=44255 RepID=UPI003EBB53D9
MLKLPEPEVHLFALCNQENIELEAAWDTDHMENAIPNHYARVARWAVTVDGDKGWHLFVRYNPTHWRPLPAPLANNNQKGNVAA